MTIFQTLDNSEAVYAVVVCFINIKGKYDHNIKDYFIVADAPDRKVLFKEGFKWSSSGKKIIHRSLSASEVEQFKAISDKYNLKVLCEHGRVYEQKNRSFKEYYDACKEEAILAE